VNLGDAKQQANAVKEFCPRILHDIAGRQGVGASIDFPKIRDSEMPSGGPAHAEPWVPLYMGAGLSADGVAADWLARGNSYPINLLNLDPSSLRAWVTVKGGECVAPQLPQDFTFWAKATNESKYLRTINSICMRRI
jgi:hypothetical protein